MILNPMRTPLPQLLPGMLIAAAILASAGCAQEKVSAQRTQNPQRLTMRDFASDEPAPIEQPDEPEQISAAPTSKQSAPSGRPAFQGDPGVTLASAAPLPRPVEILNPSDSTESQKTPKQLQLLDAKVGDVNGKPIFTSSFFAPIEDRLLAEAQRLPPSEWRASAGRIIAQRLDGIIADELLRAEALAALTPTQRVGLQAFLSNFRNNLLSENLGSSQLAAKRLQENEGVTLDEALRQKEVDTLVQLTLIREINRRVNVSWRDIKQRYDRDIDKYNPPPTAVLRVIRAFKDDTATVDQITQRLGAGDDFDQIASSELNNFNTDRQGELKKEIVVTYEETPFFGPDVLNDAAHTLSEGEYTGPIELGSSVYWIKREGSEQQRVTLYDAQLGIQRDLTYERREEAKRQYFERLQDRARVSTRDQVLLRLFEIAEERYAPKPAIKP